jgi:hypothetical protein
VNRNRLLAGVPPVALFLVVAFFSVHVDLLAYLTLVLAGVAVFALSVWLFFHNTRIECGVRSLTIRNAVGAQHTVDPVDVHEAVWLMSFAPFLAQTVAPTDRLIVLDETGRAVLTMSGRVWTAKQMRHVLGALELPVTTVQEPMTSRSVRERFPHALGPVTAHPLAARVAALIALAGIVIVVAMSGTRL